MKFKTAKELVKYAIDKSKKRTNKVESSSIPIEKLHETTSRSKINQPSSYSFLGNITRDVTNRNVFKYYEMIGILGEGSMGTVSCVRKKRSLFSKRKSQTRTGSSSSLASSAFQFSKLRNNLSFRRNVNTESSSSTDLYALKSIQKGLVTPEFMDELCNEIDILKTLDHPNIVKAFDIFDSAKEIYIVMELCSGGDLYMRTYSESQACNIILQVTSAIRHMHQMGIVHRDLKFENIMFENKSPNAQIKVIDFGLSKKCKMPGEHMTEGVGTIYTIAPEVLHGVYTYQADNWSLGVITYMLLSSVKPFYHKKRRHVVKKILNADYNYNSIVWSRISNEAKDFISSLLVIDPDKRMNAEQALESSWLMKTSQISSISSSSLNNKYDGEKMMQDIGQTLLKYSYCTSLKKMSLMIIAHKSNTSEIIKLRNAFFQYDTSGDGCISRDEFFNSMSKFNYADEEINHMFHGVDLDSNGFIAYTEFLAATLEALGYIEEEKLIEAFNQLDLDQTGFISKQNLKTMLGTDYIPEKVDLLMSQVDENNDGKISYEEFLKSFRCNKREEIDSVYHEAVVVDNLSLSSSPLNNNSFDNNSERSSRSSNSNHIVKNMKRVLSVESLKNMLK